ncbi:unnamed protein product [Allacma fusca]|uniref:C2H2-type domain-containing protein n=1 Tax=Allacma fusca TaxID=39272 RepID=A0A8J2J9I6_9HEXA|nr:unnamed protein product [Allacma fusca]
MSKDGRNPEGELETSQGGTGEITSSETNLISGGIQATEEVYLESNQTASVFDHDHDMEQCTEVQILHVCSECHLSFDSQKSLDGHMGPCLFKHINFNNILIDSPENSPRLNGIDSTKTVRVPCNQVSHQEALPQDTAITAAGLSVAAERIPVNDPATTATGQLLEINEAASGGTELLENFVNRLETTCIASATLNTGAVQNTVVVRHGEAPLLTANAGSNTNTCVVTDALLNTDNTVLRTDTGAVTDAVSNKDNDVCSPTNGIGAADSYINADKSLKTSSDPFGGLDETAIVITSVIGNYSLPAITQTEVVPTGDAAIVQGPLESEPLESVGTLPPTPISFKCQICTASLPTIKEFLKHLRDHGEKHICSICGKVCKSKSGLTRHFRCAHWLEELLPSLPSPSSGVPVRPVILNEDANLDMSSLSGEEFRCELCPKVFSTRALYLMHLKIFHRLNVSAGLDTNSKSSDSFGSCISASNENSMEVISPTGNEQCQFKCNLCSNSFILEPLLNHHLETAHGFSVLY